LTEENAEINSPIQFPRILSISTQSHREYTLAITYQSIWLLVQQYVSTKQFVSNSI